MESFSSENVTHNCNWNRLVYQKKGNILKLQCGNAKHMAKRHSIRPGTILYPNDRYDALRSS